MARIAPVNLADLPEPHAAAYQAVMAGRDGPRLNIHRTVAHSPSVLIAFVAFANELRNGTLLDPRLRELVILTVSHAKGAGYEFGKHANLALSVGVPRHQIEAIEAGAIETGTTAAAPDPAADAAPDPFDDVSRAVVAFARQAVTNVRIDDATWAAAAAHLNDRELVEVLLHVGMYSLTAHLTEGVQVDIEPWFERR
jgi:AhpD family alkylhydroperoxidase